MVNIKGVKMMNQHIYHYFQEIHSFDKNNVIGYEALLRTSDSIDPESYFMTAKNEKHLFDTDTYSIRKAITAFPFHNDTLLFVNVLPSTVIDNRFRSFINRLTTEVSFPISRVVFEITECMDIANQHVMAVACNFLRELGFLIALDDVDKGSGSLQHIVVLQPDYIKLDKFFAKELSTSLNKQRMIQSLLAYCQSDIKLVLEGIEQQEDLHIAKEIGVEIGQGFLLGKPGDFPVKMADK